MALHVPSGSGSKGRSLARFNRVATPYYFLIPAAILIGTFAAWPIARVFRYSFLHYNPTQPWLHGPAGLDNFIRIFTNDPLFSRAAMISLRWCVWQVLLQLVFGLMFALVLNAKFVGRGIVRSLMFVPWALSGVMVAILWMLIFHQNIGVLNHLLMNVLGVSQVPVAWLANVNTAFGSVVTAEVWRGIPFFAISLLAAMQNIGTELYESCDIDGGGRIAKFWYIILPFLRDTIVLTTILRFIWAFNAVDLIFVLTGGGPMGLTTTLSMYLADMAIRWQNFGYGSAIGVVVFMFMLIFSILYIKVSGFGKGLE